jgi:hypothetical protein
VNQKRLQINVVVPSWLSSLFLAWAVWYIFKELWCDYDIDYEDVKITRAVTNSIGISVVVDEQYLHETQEKMLKIQKRLEENIQ